MWKAPNRPAHQITQAYNDGMVAICRETDTALPGKLPQPRADQKIRLAYEERRLGLQRYWSAQAVEVRVDRVLRVQDPGQAGTINTQDIAVTEDGRQYRIEMVQLMTDVYPRSLDLTLQRIDPVYEVVIP